MGYLYNRHPRQSQVFYSLSNKGNGEVTDTIPYCNYSNVGTLDRDECEGWITEWQVDPRRKIIVDCCTRKATWRRAISTTQFLREGREGA